MSRDIEATMARMEDEVDRLVAAWTAERPDLDLSALAVLSRVSRIARHLDRARRAVFAEHDLEPYEFDVLTSLRRAGGHQELSPGELVGQTLVSSGTMTNRIDRLEQRGFVRRHPDRTDGRGVRVRLTGRGRAVVDAAFADLLERERHLLRALSTRRQAELAASLRSVLAPFELPVDARTPNTAAPNTAAPNTAAPNTAARTERTQG